MLGAIKGLHFTQIHALDRPYIVMREHMAERMVEMGKRQALFLSGTAKERYQFILENNPSLLKKLPLRLIASMIGITPTQLSRIRGKK